MTRFNSAFVVTLLMLGCETEGAREDAPMGLVDARASALDAPGSDAPGAMGADAMGSDAPLPTVDAMTLAADAPRTAMEELTSLPPDTGGMHTPHPLGTTSAAFGYYAYVPGGYSETSADYPLIVFLHGQGERGDGVGQLNRVLNQGLPRLIERDMFDPAYPVIVASPQFYPLDRMGNENNWGELEPSHVRGFIEHMIATYRINTHRIYLTGLSHGGNGVFDYLMLQDDATSYVAAAAPIAAWGPGRNFARANDTPIWVFVGSADGGNFTSSRNFATGYNAQVPAPAFRARFTVYAGAGHDVWTRTYNLTGMGMADPMYDAYDVPLYDWFFSHRR